MANVCHHCVSEPQKYNWAGWYILGVIAPVRGVVASTPTPIGLTDYRIVTYPSSIYNIVYNRYSGELVLVLLIYIAVKVSLPLYITVGGRWRPLTDKVFTGSPGTTGL